MRATLLTLAGLTALVLFLAPAPERAAAPADPPGPRDRIEPRTLASWIVSNERHFHLIDVRPRERFVQDGIRTAESMPADSLDPAAIRAIPSGHMIVLYGETDDDVIDTFRRVRAVHEQTYVLAGGREACEKEVLSIPEPPNDQSETAWDEYRTLVALARYLSGETDVAPVPVARTVRPMVRPRIKVKNEGC